MCPGGQGDVSVHGNLLVMSVEQTRGRIDCGTQGVEPAVSAERFRGVRIFDITDVKKPKQVAAVQTCRGSHTHTLVTIPNDKANLYVYGSGTGTVRSGRGARRLFGLDPKEDPNTALFSIDVIQIPIAAPRESADRRPAADFCRPGNRRDLGALAGRQSRAGHADDAVTNQCHDITVFPEVGLAAGACSGNGILLDISDPVKPVRLDHVMDKNFAYWHSATFNNDGTKVLFTDEWGGGTRPRCRATDLPNWGADAIFDIVDRKMKFGGYYKMPAPQTEQENCVAHNGSLIPVPGSRHHGLRRGTRAASRCSTSPTRQSRSRSRSSTAARSMPSTSSPPATGRATGTTATSTATEIARGIDVFRLTPSEYLSQNEIDAAAAGPDERVQRAAAAARRLAGELRRRARVRRSAGAQQGDPAGAGRRVTAALERADRVRSGRDNGAAAVVDQLGALVSQLEGDAAAAGGRDAVRLRSLAANLKERASTLQ